LWARLSIFLAVVGLGIITANVDNDAGGLTTYNQAGAHFGLGMLWIVIPTAVLLIMVQEMLNRMGVVTGQGLSDMIRERFGVKFTFFSRHSGRHTLQLCRSAGGPYAQLSAALPRMLTIAVDSILPAREAGVDRRAAVPSMT
jgi:Mn2+/Fe2+ NRAMP family transporter